MPKPGPRSLVIVQYAGDYAEAYRRIKTGGPETYYAQRYSIAAVSSLVTPTTSVTTICCTADADEDLVLDNGVRSINLHSPLAVDEHRVWAKVMSCRPTHLCLRTPLPRVLTSALNASSIESILLTLADSFDDTGLRARFRAWRLSRLLNHSKVEIVGNHGLNASRSLSRIGVHPEKIVPWDWPHEITPHAADPKTARQDSNWRALFVGALLESKGIGDAMRAVRVLKDSGRTLRLDYAGRGDVEKFANLARELGIEEQVNYLGLVAHSAVVPLMRDADFVIVPSHHDYPEGFPMTIYEALSSRTPIIASDHPMYAPHLLRTKAAIVYTAGDQAALAAALLSAMDDPNLYADLSAASAGAWDELQIPVTWGDMLSTWMNRGHGESLAILKYALAHEAAAA